MNKLGIATLIVLVSIALWINHKISTEIKWQKEADKAYKTSLNQPLKPVTGYFGNGCTEVYIGEADRIIEGLKYKLRKDLYDCIKKMQQKKITYDK